MAEKILEVGYIVKAHGLKGEVIVGLISNRTERVAPESSLICGARTLRIVSSSPHQGRWIVKFEGIDNRTSAESLKGLALLAPRIEDETVFWVDEMIGLAVFDQVGNSLGVVRSVQENPASDLLVLESGALIPLRFALDGDKHYRHSGAIYVDIPEGLIGGEI